MSPHRVVFPVSPYPFIVFIALVARDVDHHARLAELPQRLQEMNGPHDVGGVGFDGILVAAAHDGLSSHVNDNIGSALGYRRLQAREVANVRANGADGVCDLRLFEQARLGWRVERVSGHVGSESIQPQREPASLEAGMSGEEHFAASPERTVRHGCLFLPLQRSCIYSLPCLMRSFAWHNY